MAKKCRGRRKNRPPPPPEFNTGDYVLAKMKGHRPWPARIVNVDEVELPPKQGKFAVIFYGDNTQALISPEKLSHFEPQLYNDLPKITHHQRRFAKAVTEILDAIEADKSMVPPEHLAGDESLLPELEAPVTGRSSENISELILKAKDKKDWTLDSNDALLEDCLASIKNCGGTEAYFKLITEESFKVGELGYAERVMEYLINMIDTSSSGHKIKFLYLVDYMVRKAYESNGTQGQQYLREIKNKLSNFVIAATSTGVGATANRRRCLTILKGW